MGRPEGLFRERGGIYLDARDGDDAVFDDQPGRFEVGKRRRALDEQADGVDVTGRRVVQQGAGRAGDLPRVPRRDDAGLVQQ